MTSPRPSLASSTSVVSSSGSEGEVEEDARHIYPPVPAATSTTTKTTLTVNKVEVQKGAQAPGVLHGTVLNANLNFFINQTDDVDPADVTDIVEHAVKINQQAVKSFLPSDCNGSANKLIGTSENVEKLSRRWCYLITSLVILSLITLLGTAVLSLTSWKTSQRGLPVPSLDPATENTAAGLSAEEKHFAGLPNGPRIVTRSMWLAAPSRRPLDRNALPVSLVVVCHTATRNCTTQPECIDLMRAMQTFHQEKRGYPDLGYSFVIGGDGSVYWSLGFDYVGRHTGRFSNGSIGVAFVGNYIHVVPSDSQIDAFNKLIGLGVREGKISPDYSLVAQCQLQTTAAPGLALVSEMASWPHFNTSLPVNCTTE